MSVPTLAGLMDQLSDTILTSPEGIPSAMLHLIDDGGGMHLMALTSEDGSRVGGMARLVVAKQDPALAVLAVEAKAAITRPSVREEQDPDLRRLLRGHTSVGKLPTEKRRQMVMLYGEDRAGNEAFRVWQEVAPSGRGRRQYVPITDEIAEVLHSSLRPLYTFRALLVGSRLNEFQARKLARDRAVREMERLGMVAQDPFPQGPFQQ